MRSINDNYCAGKSIRTVFDFVNLFEPAIHVSISGILSVCASIDSSVDISRDRGGTLQRWTEGWTGSSHGGEVKARD